MKIALLGTGFGQAHAAVYAQRPDVDEVIAACEIKMPVGSTGTYGKRD